MLLGSSGAGKSTLTNTLAGYAIQDTGAVREHDSRGKHTTTARSLHQLPSGACIIDTPGVRTLRPDVDAQTLGQLFGDVAALSGACRFRDCQHADEPGCAVRAQVAPERLRNYHKLLRESRRDTLSALDRQRQLADWKARGRAGRQRLEMNRGDG
ncbi:GTPase RsgA [Rhodoferax sp.]|uniref:GTPase RsgA n=1 Tax=Rhodoferax sp. TaxID=50421 RepID=UPI0039B8C455